MLLLRPRLLEYLAPVADDDGVGGDDQRGLAPLRIVDFPPVHVQRLLGRCLQRVFERRHALGEVFGEVGGDNVDLGEAYLRIGMGVLLA